MKKRTLLFLAICGFLVGSCSVQPTPISYGKDLCDFCKMTIMEPKFAAELVTTKGKVFKFDDLHCLVQYKQTASDKTYAHEVVNNYASPAEFIALKEAIYLHGEAYRSPMRGDVAAFAIGQAPTAATRLTWADVQQKFTKK